MKEKEVRWARMFPDQLEAEFARCPLVYFPYGLCEPHGPHDAIGLDALKAEGIACAAARSFGGIVAPTDYWHVHELGGYAVWSSRYVGEVARTWLTSVPPWVHFRNVCYHVRAADVIGFHAALFITGHYGPNWEDLKTVLGLLQPYTKTRLYGLPDWEANQPGFDNDGVSGGDHAGKVETSLLWALDPACVDLSRIPDSARTDPPAGHFEEATPPPAPKGGPGMAARPPYMAMGTDAVSSNRRTGERMVADEVRVLSAKASELLESYDEGAEAPGLKTFAAVESAWRKAILPVLPEFKSMSPDFGRGGEVHPDSVWYENWEVPTDLPPGDLPDA